MIKERKLLERASDFISEYCIGNNLEGSEETYLNESENKEMYLKKMDFLEEIETYLSNPERAEKFSAEDVIQAANECAKESQRNGAPMTDEDALNLVKNS